MDCYSHYDPHRTECGNCRYRSYCIDSVDPPLINDRMVDFDIGRVPERREHGSLREQPRYSKEEMMELIGYLAELDVHTLELLSEKLHDPDISCEAIGAKRSITRQAVHKLIKKRCSQHPELTAILMNRRHRQDPLTTTTFLEAVCQIKRSQQKNRSRKPAPHSDSWNSLTSLSRSLDLSRMSIGKDTVY